MKEFIAVIALIALGLFLYAFTVGPMQNATKGFLDGSVNKISAIEQTDYSFKPDPKDLP